MPLIDFRTNLTSLQYGKDRPGGGDSGQPYIKFPIEGQPTPDILQTYYDINKTSLDFPIRGGAISQLLDSTVAGAIDRDRIQKFFNDAPRGTAFIEKQIGLQLTNPRTQVPQALAFVGGTIGNAVLPTTQTYNPLNTLAQVRVQGTGLHFNRHGVTPTIYESERLTYENFAGNPVNNTGTTNRLAVLRAIKLIGDTGFTIDPTISSGAGIDPDLVERLGISVLQNQLFNYSGGPGSVYGIGTTIINRVTNTEPTADPITDIAYSTIALTYQQLAAQPTPKSRAHPEVDDYRKAVNLNVPGVNQQPEFEYEEESLEWRLGVGNPGLERSDLSVYTNVSKRAQDTVNLRSAFYYDSVDQTPWEAGDRKQDGMTTTDIVKFAFECLSNDSPGSAVGLIFRAFFDGQITDNNSAEYNTFRYLGRGELFRTYQGFNRSISFSFKIAAQTRDEMRPLYRKLNHLISQVYPDYSPGTNLMRGNVVRLTIGDYIYRMPGFLENVNVTIDNSTTPWEILLDRFDEGDLRQLPHFVTVACTFYPILDILPRREKQGDSDVQLIVNRDVQVREPEPATPVTPAAPVQTPPPDYGPVGPVNQPPNYGPVGPVNQPPPKKVAKKRKKPTQKTVPKPQQPQKFNFVEQLPPVRDNTRIAGPGLASGMGTAGGF